MRRELLEILACPEDKAPLRLESVALDEVDGDIRTASLSCTACGFTYPIEDGIPNLLPKAMHDDTP